MDVKVFVVLFWACATWQMSVHANAECIYEGQSFKTDNKGQLPLQTNRQIDTEEECKVICDSQSTCVIWQWQPTKKLCWIIYVDPKTNRYSDFGINNCKEGKPTENAPKCQVKKGDRVNVWDNHWGMTKEGCIDKCSEDSDCLIWQYLRDKRLCKIHKLKVDTTKSSEVGIHYCSNSGTCTLCSTCGVIDNASRNNTVNRIVGGTESVWTAHSYTVKLQMTSITGRKYFCSGSFISGRSILTAAHCLYDDQERRVHSIRAMVGPVAAQASSPYMRICAVFEHPDHRIDHYGNDIAIIHVCNSDLDENSFIMNYVDPVCLPQHRNPDFYGIVYEGISAKALGYGRIQYGGTFPNTLLEVQLNTHSNAACETKFSLLPSHKPVPLGDQICASNIGMQGICKGDSGGPLVIINNGQHIQIGVANLFGCRENGQVWPSVFARTSVHRDFIQRYM